MKSDAIDITLKHEYNSQNFKIKSDMKTYEKKTKREPLEFNIQQLELRDGWV